LNALNEAAEKKSLCINSVIAVQESS
jgi:hypothetical protein